ncbi:hypothetical protein Mal65_45120 [Crateriforma conspicua]|nr:hypothetical protein Mal65_45120 [Crateriforma conspicua]
MLAGLVAITLGAIRCHTLQGRGETRQVQNEVRPARRAARFDAHWKGLLVTCARNA